MMNEVLEYIETTAKIFFEKGHLSCQFCPLMETYSRNSCRLTGELLIDPKYTVGHWCPLRFEEGEENET